MKQNIYDNEVFFEGYTNLRKDKFSLNRTLEEPVMLSLLPNLQGLHILDVGCGFGNYCKLFADQGASKVIGIDISTRMVELARQNNANPIITFMSVAVEDANFASNSFDLITSSLALHYIRDYEAVIQKLAKWLKPGGKFVFSIEHPLTTALPEQQWVCDSSGYQLHWPVDNYSAEGPRATTWFVEGVTKYHRTIATYVNALLTHSFKIMHFGEPIPEEAFIKVKPELYRWVRIPGFLFISAQKEVL